MYYQGHIQAGTLINRRGVVTALKWFQPVFVVFFFYLFFFKSVQEYFGDLDYCVECDINVS